MTDKAQTISDGPAASAGSPPRHSGAEPSTRPPASAGPAGVSSPTAPPDPVASCREAAARETCWPVVRYVSLFAGVEAFSVASSRIAGARWEPVFFSEIDPFPCAVLAHRFPDVPNLGDVSKIKVRETADGKREITNGSASIPFPAGGIDILAGGSPCQDVSLAGLRRGFADGTRSSLAFEYARLVGELRPRVLLWENVAGVLSSRGGRDFAALLRRLDELGYGLAWRVLDVQWTRVDGPMPGGGWGGFPRAIPQRRDRVWIVGLDGEPGTSAAEILFERYGVPGHSPPRREAGKGFAAPAGYCPALAAQARGGGGGGRGFDLLAFGEYGEGGVASTVNARDFKDATDLVAEPIAPPPSAPMTAADSADKAPRGGSSPSRSASFDGTDCAPTLHRPNGGPGANGCGISAEAAHTLDRAEGQAVAVPGGEYVVRRLTPRECERLQGFPDDWTRIPYRGKPAEECPDGPRYKAMGNSWGTNCAEWILRRLLAARPVWHRETSTETKGKNES